MTEIEIERETSLTSILSPSRGGVITER